MGEAAARDLGGVRVRALIASRFWLDGGSMFGAVPKPLWSRFSKADAQNRIELVARILWIESGGQQVLVDTGLGAVHTGQERERLGLAERPLALPEALRAAGCEPEAVTHLILTHLHFDHVGGLCGGGPTSSTRPTLPNARPHVSRAQWEHAWEPGPKERRSFRTSDLEALAALRPCLHDGPAEILPGIRVVPSEGHTHGLWSVTVEGSRDRLCYPSDLIPTLAHLRLAYTTGYDLWPERLLAEKEALLEKAVAGNALVVFAHDPRTTAGRIAGGRDGFVLRMREDI